MRAQKETIKKSFTPWVKKTVSILLRRESRKQVSYKTIQLLHTSTIVTAYYEVGLLQTLIVT